MGTGEQRYGERQRVTLAGDGVRVCLHPVQGERFELLSFCPDRAQIQKPDGAGGVLEGVEHVLIAQAEHCLGSVGDFLQRSVQLGRKFAQLRGGAVSRRTDQGNDRAPILPASSPTAVDVFQLPHRDRGSAYRRMGCDRQRNLSQGVGDDAQITFLRFEGTRGQAQRYRSIEEGRDGSSAADAAAYP